MTYLSMNRISKQRRKWLFPLLIALLICVARFIYVSLYAHSLPFWDQWDEVNSIIGSWQRHSFQIRSLFSPHNEHRIAFTRLVTIILFLFNNHTYDNLVESYANGIIYALTLTLLFLLICKEMRDLPRLIVGISIITIGILPFDWENTLVGFQNQFYFMILFSTAIIGLITYGRPTLKNGAWILLVAIACLFTMASGVLAVLTAVILLTIRRFSGNVYFPPVIVLALLCILIIGFFDIPTIDRHQQLKSHGIVEFISAFFSILIWPSSQLTAKHLLLDFLIWLPTIVSVIRSTYNRQSTPSDFFSLGLSIWVILQIAAISYSRGHDLHLLISRYSEIVAIGLVSNLAIALQLTKFFQKTSAKRTWITITAITTFLVTYTFINRTYYDLEAMEQRFVYNKIETINTINYLFSKNISYLQQPDIQAPYPDALRLQSFLSDKSIVSSLPISSWERQVRVYLLPYGLGSSSSELSTMAIGLQEAVNRTLAMAGIVAPNAAFTPIAKLNFETRKSIACSLDAVNEKHIDKDFRSAAGLGVSFIGWIFDQREKLNAFSIIIAGKKSYSFEVKTYIPRPDVVKAFHAVTAAKSGFSAIAILTGIEPGTYRILLASRTDLTATCDTGRAATITASP